MLLLMVQTPGVCDANVTARPDDAVAVIVNGGVPMTLFDNGSNVIVCVSKTVKLRSTSGAGE